MTDCLLFLSCFFADFYNFDREEIQDHFNVITKRTKDGFKFLSNDACFSPHKRIRCL
jgi:hypothetical protein